MVLVPKTAAKANTPSESDAPCGEATLMCITDRSAAYNGLESFAARIGAEAGQAVVEAFEQEGMGLGLRVVRDVPSGGHLVYYGGPYQEIRRHGGGPSRSHSLQVVDHDLPPERQDPSVIDGKVVGAIFRDPIASDAHRATVLTIAGALINSSVSEKKNLAANVRLSSEDALFMSVNGVRYAAKRFVAARNLPAGTQLLWKYKWCNERTNPLAFAHPPLPAPQPAKLARLEVVMSQNTMAAEQNFRWLHQQTWTVAESARAGSTLPVRSFTTQCPARRFLAGQCPLLAKMTPPMCELGLQWAGEYSLAPGEYIGE